MNKTKKLYILGIGLIVVMFIWYLVVVPIVAFFYSFIVALALVAVPMILGVVLYAWNVPKHYKGKFYEHPTVTKIQKSRSRRFIYRKPLYSFSCAHAVIEMILKRHDVEISQEEIFRDSGYKKAGMIHTELEDTLNDLFFRKALDLKAKINYFTTYSQLFDAIQQDKIVIVMYINHFTEEGYSTQSQYPHYALLNHINMSIKEEKNKAVLTSPTFGKGNKNFAPGKYEGEIVMSLDEFVSRIYPEDYFLRHMEHKKTQTENARINIWHKFLNFLFKFGIYTGYCTRIVKPGLTIIIEPKK